MLLHVLQEMCNFGVGSFYEFGNTLVKDGHASLPTQNFEYLFEVFKMNAYCLIIRHVSYNDSTKPCANDDSGVNLILTTWS